MKKGVRIVNAARGELINEADLAAAIEERPGRGRGAGCFRRGATEKFVR